MECEEVPMKIMKRAVSGTKMTPVEMWAFERLTRFPR
jgi:hypothetical protein